MNKSTTTGADATTTATTTNITCTASTVATTTTTAVTVILHSLQTGSWAHPPTHLVDAGGTIPGGKAAGA
jgi:hypothetical protein